MKYTFYLISIFVFAACVKKPKYSNIPEISFKSFDIISPDTAILRMNFSDGDGDVGGGPEGQGNMFITYYFWDNDSNKYDLFIDTTGTFLHDTIDVRTFPAPPGTNNNKPVSGEIAVRLFSYRPNDNIKKLKMTAYIQDNSGNKSNPIKTPDIYAP